MADKTGVARLRQAIENQASVGEVSFSMPFDEASALLRECEDELARLAWANGVPAPVDADGEVVPLTAKVMYGDDGTEYGVPNFMYGEKGWEARLFSSIPGIRNFMDVALLHLRRPDSWERLEEDVRVGIRPQLPATSTYEDATVRLADLIDCPTCEMKWCQGERYVICTRWIRRRIRRATRRGAIHTRKEAAMAESECKDTHSVDAAHIKEEKANGVDNEPNLKEN